MIFNKDLLVALQASETRTHAVMLESEQHSYTHTEKKVTDSTAIISQHITEATHQIITLLAVRLDRLERDHEIICISQKRITDALGALSEQITNLVRDVEGITDASDANYAEVAVAVAKLDHKLTIAVPVFIAQNKEVTRILEETAISLKDAKLNEGNVIHSFSTAMSQLLDEVGLGDM